MVFSTTETSTYFEQFIWQWDSLRLYRVLFLPAVDVLRRV